jgi:hypothetical protein
MVGTFAGMVAVIGTVAGTFAGMVAVIGTVAAGASSVALQFVDREGPFA